MQAKYGGQCALECGVAIKPGDEIIATEGGWSHEHCPETPDTLADRQAKKQRWCPRCFCHHAGEC